LSIPKPSVSYYALVARYPRVLVGTSELSRRRLFGTFTMI
jgi:hypothetical protein